MALLNVFIIVSPFSIGCIWCPLAQGVSVKFDLRGKFSISFVLSGRQRGRTYSEWIAVNDTDYAIHDTIGDFYWVKVS
jgi:hypothetical protein